MWNSLFKVPNLCAPNDFIGYKSNVILNPVQGGLTKSHQYVKEKYQYGSIQKILQNLFIVSIHVFLI